MTPDRAPDNGRFFELDILRGVASLLVVAFHYVHFYHTDQFQPDLYVDVPFFDLLRPIYSHGQWFVELFFTISGYVFFWLYREPIMAGAVSFRTFVIARLARLYPLYIATLILTAGLMIIFHSLYGYDYVYQANTAGNFALSALMIQQWWPGAVQSFNGPVWSISVEMGLYGLFFLFCTLKLGRRWLWVIVAVTTPLMWLWPEIAFFRGLPSFFLGGIAYFVARELSGVGVPIRKGILGVVAAGWIAAYLFGHDGLMNGQVSWVFSREVMVLGLMPLTLVAVELWRGAIPSERLKPFVWLGDISYSTYLIHFPLQLLIMIGLNGLAPATKAAVIASPLFFMAFFGALIGVSILSYGQFEMKARLWLLRRFSPRYRH